MKSIAECFPVLWNNAKARTLQNHVECRQEGNGERKKNQNLSSIFISIKQKFEKQISNFISASCKSNPQRSQFISPFFTRLFFFPPLSLNANLIGESLTVRKYSCYANCLQPAIALEMRARNWFIVQADWDDGWRKSKWKRRRRKKSEIFLAFVYFTIYRKKPLASIAIYIVTRNWSENTNESFMSLRIADKAENVVKNKTSYTCCGAVDLSRVEFKL